MRQVLCKYLAWDDANCECQEIIDALPGHPMLTDMVNKGFKIAAVDHKVSALMVALHPGQKSSGGGQQKKSKNKGKKKQGTHK